MGGGGQGHLKRQGSSAMCYCYMVHGGSVRKNEWAGIEKECIQKKNLGSHLLSSILHPRQIQTWVLTHVSDPLLVLYRETYIRVGSFACNFL